MLTIYTDGGIDKNPGGTARWAYYCVETGYSCTGIEERSTNNRAELLAVIYAIDWARCDCLIVSDSKYCVNIINQWIKHWRLKENYAGKLNADLLREIDLLTTEFKIKAKWVRGHSDNKYNNLVDNLCRVATSGEIRH